MNLTAFMARQNKPVLICTCPRRQTTDAAAGDSPYSPAGAMLQLLLGNIGRASVDPAHIWITDQSQIELGLACHQVPLFRAANHWLELVDPRKNHVDAELYRSAINQQIVTGNAGYLDFFFESSADGNVVRQAM